MTVSRLDAQFELNHLQQEIKRAIRIYGSISDDRRLFSWDDLKVLNARIVRVQAFVNEANWLT
jgi:hypothetical protein